MAENRTHNIRVRITDAERQAVEKAARDAGFGKNLSDYIRQKLGLK